MKQTYSIIALLLATVSTTATTITGTWPGGDGRHVYIQQRVERQVLIIDSAMVENGRFNINKPFDGVKEVIFRAGTTTQPFLLEQAPIVVNITTREREDGTPQQPQVTIAGSPEQDIYRTFLNAVRGEMMTMLGISFMSRDTNVSQETVDSVAMLYQRAQVRTQRLFDSLIENNPDRVASAIIINTQSNAWGLEKTEKMYNLLAPHVKASTFGQQILNTINVMKSVSSGVPAPDFALIDREGKPVSLAEYRGQYLLLDFWGSWCAPCRRSHPRLIEAYKKYQHLNFEILGLANERQADNMAWLTAIEQGGLPWRQVNLRTNQTGQQVLDIYNITAYPTKILIDPNGTIIGTFTTNADEMYDTLHNIFGR